MKENNDEVDELYKETKIINHATIMSARAEMVNLDDELFELFSLKTEDGKLNQNFKPGVPTLIQISKTLKRVADSLGAIEFMCKSHKDRQ